MTTAKPTQEQMDELQRLIAEKAEQDAGYPEKGSDLDHSKYLFEDGSEGFYDRAVLEETPSGLRYVFDTNEWLTESRSYSANSREKFDEQGLPKNLGDYLTFMELQEQPWVTFTVLPGVSGMGVVVMRRKVRRMLPLPTPRTTEEIVTEAALETAPNVEGSIEDWAKAQGIALPSEDVE
jgi:hypothetical protein